MLQTKGLRNCGITCYLNSAMQLLFNIEEIQQYFTNYNFYDTNSDKYKKLNKDEKELILILNNLKQIYYIIFRTNNDIDTIITGEEYNKLIEDSFNKIFKNGDYSRQQESFEIVQTIFNKFSWNYDNTDLQNFKDLLNKLFDYTKSSTRTYDKNKYKCNYTFDINTQNEKYFEIRSDDLDLVSNKTNFIDQIFKIHIENNTNFDYKCKDDNNKPILDVNGKPIEIKEIQIKHCYDVQSKYIIINFIPYTMGGLIEYGIVELDKSFRVNNINYKIKGIVIHTGSLKGGHYYYLHFENDQCTQYDDETVEDNYKLSEKNNKYFFNTKQQPIVIIYENDNTINPSKKINYDCMASIQQPIIARTGSDIKIEQLKNLIDIHFTKLEYLLKALEKK